jgi:hypothetical protein
MIIQFSRAEVERILLAHANATVKNNPFDNLRAAQVFDTVSCNSYRDIPDVVSVSTKEIPDAAQ